MKTTYSITEAQGQLPRLVREVQQHSIRISKHQETVAYLISSERMKSIAETLEVLGNPEAVSEIKKLRAGKTKFKDLDELDESSN